MAVILPPAVRPPDARAIAVTSGVGGQRNRRRNRGRGRLTRRAPMAATRVDVDRQQEFVLRTLEERDIRFVRLWFTDVLGTLKSVSVAPAELEAAFEEGIGFDGSAIEGFARVYESDMVAMPDPTTFQVFPFEGGGQRRERPDVLRHPAARRQRRPGPTRGTCCAGRCPRRPRRASPSTPTPRSSSSCCEDGPPDGSVPMPVDAGGYFDHTTHAVARDFRRQAVLALERIGISVEFSHHEVAPGQQEIDLRYADALTTADNIMTFRHVVKEVALSHGRARHLHAQAVHRPARQRHAHPPVAVRGRAQRVPRPGDDPMKLSKIAQGVHRRAADARPRVHRGHQPVGQLVQAALPAGSCRTGSPRRRRTSAGATSTGPRWSGCRRTASRTRPGSRSARSTRPCNPYLAFAVLLGAGLQGHRGGLRAAAGRRGRRLVAVQRRAHGDGLRRAAGEPRPRRST